MGAARFQVVVQSPLTGSRGVSHEQYQSSSKFSAGPFLSRGEEEFLRLTGLEPERLADLLQLDWLDHTDTENATLFSGRDVYRVRKLERICCDFGLPVVGGTIIVDLLERIEELEQQVRSLQGFEEN